VRGHHRAQQRLSCYPGKGSFFKAHVDTPRSEKMFGSLVIVFPTPHEGGALLLRHRGQEWTFDSAATLATASPSSIAYAAFFSDTEHEVAPVVSGHRVTLTYNLYFDDERAPAKDLVTEPPIPQVTNENAFRSAFEALLENAEFLPDGGTLGFGLRHVYQVEGGLEHVYGLLKGSDAAVYQSVRALGFEPVLYLYYESGSKWSDHFEAVLIDRVLNFEGGGEVESLIGMLRYHGGIVVRHRKEDQQNDQEILWVTPVTTFNRQSNAYVAYGNEATLGLAYGDICLVVRIGKAGERLVYKTVAQLKEEWEEEQKARRFRYY
jgi:2OG-Fe(II) oxygenase superfamily